MVKILIVLVSFILISIFEQSNTTLSRRKRYLVYPPGSILQLGYCLTIRSIIPNRIFAHGFTFGTNWELPSETIRRKYHKAEVVHRMDRRDLYNKLIPMIQVMGLNGRECVLRALCQAGQRAKDVKGSFLAEILNAIFRLPPGDEEEDFDKAHRSKGNCAELFSACGEDGLELDYF